jgi:hypothetical protein
VQRTEFPDNRGFPPGNDVCRKTEALGGAKIAPAVKQPAFWRCDTPSLFFRAARTRGKEACFSTTAMCTAQMSLEMAGTPVVTTQPAFPVAGMVVVTW